MTTVPMPGRGNWKSPPSMRVQKPERSKKNTLPGKAEKGSWKVAENNIIKRQNRILYSIWQMFEKASVALEKWKEWLNDFRREQGRDPHYGRNDLPDRGAGKASLRDFKGTGTDGNHGQADQRTGSRLSEMVRISLEAKQREQTFAETERGIAEAFRAIEKARDVNERFEKLLSRRAGRTAVGRNGNNAERTGRKGADYLTAQIQLEDSLRLIERLNKENRAENVEALKKDLQNTRKILNAKIRERDEANIMIGSLRSKLEEAVKEIEYVKTHQKTVEVPVKVPELHEKCESCDRTAYLRSRGVYEKRKRKLEKEYRRMMQEIEGNLRIASLFCYDHSVFCCSITGICTGCGQVLSDYVERSIMAGRWNFRSGEIGGRDQYLYISSYRF